MNLRYLLLLALAGICGAVPLGRAAEPLRLEEAVSRAIAANPALAAEAASIRATEARAGREGLGTPYVVGGDFENFAGTGALRGADAAETTLRIGRAIELGGKREARQSLGSAEVRRQQHVAEVARIDIASRTAARFVEVAADQQRLAVAIERVKQAERALGEVASWVAAARNPESDLRNAEIAVADAELEREHAEHELASARMTLAASWGALTPDFETVVADLRTLPEIPTFDVLAARLPMTLAERTALLETEEAQARRRIAEASAKPDINLSLGVRRLEALDDQGLVFSVSVPLGTKSRSRYAIAEADAQLSAIELQRQARRFEERQSLFAKYQELVHARTEYDAVQARMLPKSEQALAFTRRGFQAGRFSFIAFLQAQKTHADLQARSIEAAARYHVLLIDIERLTHVAAEATP